ncbi:MAG: PilZ domain-containing protein [Pyrinomonadaceae bacterium]
MSLPIKVEVKIDRKMGFDEITRLKDVSAFGTGFLLSRPVKRGRLLHLTIPMPRKLRTFDFAEPQYRIWGIVRRCIKIKSANSEPEKYSIGVGFIGRTPPESYNDNPSKIYDISHREEKGFWNIFESDCKPDESHLPKDARRHTRFKIPASLLVETLDDNGNTISSEQTVTENISLSGAAIFSSFNPQIGSFVRIKSQQFNVSIISIVRGVRLANDGIKRLHIEFIDRFFPLEGIE